MNITRIYLVENCYGDPNKVYIGKEKSHKSRSRYTDHKKTFGKDIIFTYIDSIEGWDIENWKPLEYFWIEYFRQLGFDIQNKNKGGCGPSFQTEKTKQRISKSSKYKNSKPILQYDLNGDFIKEWKSISECCEFNNFSINNISTCCKKETNQAYNFIWRFKQNNSKLDIKSILKKIDNKKILQYDLQGNFIQEWNSLSEVSNKLNLNINSILQCCEFKIKRVGNYIFRKKKDIEDITKKIKPYSNKNKQKPTKKIIQLDINNNFIREWNSSKEISIELNLRRDCIIFCCLGKQKTSGGFKWRYK